MKRISIIIPIYNTGEYLHKCIKSILSQTLTDFELILVDDGSVDESCRICDEYAMGDDRIKVIHKENEGVSIARNTALGIAEGEYIGFIDSDDWIEPDMYERLYNHAIQNNCDIVMCDAVTKYDDKPDEQDTITQLQEDALMMKEDISPELLCEIAGSAWRCIYKREMISVKGIVFPENIPLSEDRIFNILAMGYAKAIYYTKTPFYNRYVRKGSAVSKYYGNYLEIIEKVHHGTMNALKTSWSEDDKYEKHYEIQTFHMAINAVYMPFYKTSPLTFRQKIQAVKDVCNNNTIRRAISVLNSSDFRAKLIIKKRVLLLCIVAVLMNKKNGR